MRFWLVLASMLLSLVPANAQADQSPRSQETQMLGSEQRAKNNNAVEPVIRVYRECDNVGGCCFDGNMDEWCKSTEFEKERARFQDELQRRANEAQTRAQQRLQDELQRRANEANKRLLEAQQK